MPRYRVTSPHVVLDNEPGAEFDADIPEVQAERLLAAGALELVSDESAPDPEE